MYGCNIIDIIHDYQVYIGEWAIAVTNIYGPIMLSYKYIFSHWVTLYATQWDMIRQPSCADLLLIAYHCIF